MPEVYGLKDIGHIRPRPKKRTRIVNGVIVRDFVESPTVNETRVRRSKGDSYFAQPNMVEIDLERYDEACGEFDYMPFLLGALLYFLVLVTMILASVTSLEYLKWRNERSIRKAPGQTG